MNRSTPWVQQADGYLDRTPWVRFLLIGILFGMWGLAVALNDVLIAQFKEIFELSNFASALVQFAYWGAYFVVCLPTSMIVKRFSYKTAVLIGLGVFILGALLFNPAADAGSYYPFLAAIFIMAIGAGMLEMSCGTYVCMMGDAKGATLRPSICQTINPLGNIGGILMGKVLIFSADTRLSEAMERLSGSELEEFRRENLHMTLRPYVVIAIILAVLFLLIAVQKYPTCKVDFKDGEKQAGTIETIGVLLRNKLFMAGWFAQFCAIGSQLAIWSFTIRLALELDPTLTESQGTNYMLYSYIVFFLGRFLNAALLKIGVSEYKLMTIYFIICVVILVIVFSWHSFNVMYILIAFNLFQAPLWPVLYGTNVRNVERKYTENAGALITMTLVGGAIWPAIMGVVADTFSMQISFVIPTIGFVITLIFVAFEWSKEKSQTNR